MSLTDRRGSAFAAASDQLLQSHFLVKTWHDDREWQRFDLLLLENLLHYRTACKVGRPLAEQALNVIEAQIQPENACRFLGLRRALFDPILRQHSLFLLTSRSLAIEGVTGRVLEKRIAQRRIGDQLVADNRRLLALGWKPRFDDLPAIIEHAYNWQRALASRPPVLDDTVRV